MRIYAHRGASGFYPENTMVAFDQALEAKSDGIELDIQLSKDGHVVIIHDERVDRTTDGSGRVCDYTLLRLKRFNAAKTWKDGVNSIRSLPSTSTVRGYGRRTWSPTSRSRAASSTIHSWRRRCWP